MSSLLSASLNTTLSRLQLVAYLQAGTCALLIYDYILTFEAELELIFPSPWNAGKILFFLTRYVAFMPHAIALYVFLQNVQVSYDTDPLLSMETCLRMYSTYSYIIIAGIVTAELILSVRVYALWGKSRRIGGIMTVAGVGCIVGAVVQFARAAAGGSSSAGDPRPEPMDSVPHLHGCFPIQISTNRATIDASFVCFMALVGYETMIFSMTVLRAFQEWRERGTGRASQLVISFYKDGVMYFVFALSTSLLNMALNAPKDVPLEYTNLLLPLQHALHSIITGRMMLHLRRQVKDAIIIPSARGTELEGIQFAGVPQTTQTGTEISTSIP
ncbi:hypothetical protein BDZ89DRAFT_1070014 [Hymenopellis radicata]|nr:hypothetical protein BDZ89DRAFT_1070014 [Hymenopellis radicata]